MSDQGEFSWEELHTHGGGREPETSFDAASAARRVSGAQKRMVFEFLLRSGMTQDELREATGLGDNAAKRCSDLHNEGCIRDSGRRRDSNRGRPAVIWEVTEFGKTLYGVRSNGEPDNITFEDL